MKHTGIEKLFEWEPLISVGPFLFGSNITDYIKKYYLLEEPGEYEEEVEWTVYRLPNIDMRIYTENEVIVSIACHDCCKYNGLNIIGLTINEVKNFLGLMDHDSLETLELPEGPQDVFEFDDLSVQFWVENEKIVTVICGPPYEDE